MVVKVEEPVDEGAEAEGLATVVGGEHGLGGVDEHLHRLLDEGHVVGQGHAGRQLGVAAHALQVPEGGSGVIFAPQVRQRDPGHCPVAIWPDRSQSSSSSALRLDLFAF